MTRRRIETTPGLYGEDHDFGEVVVRNLAALLVAKSLLARDPQSIALSAHPGFLRIINRSRAQFRRGQTISLAEMKAAYGGERSPNRLQPDEVLHPTGRVRRKGKSRPPSRAARG